MLHSDEPITGTGRAVGWPDQNYYVSLLNSFLLLRSIC